ncbi:hypothetical protein GUJ93_ZPchr0016g2548 [Zizania palustris]|uniref:Uncharacterized protein n=1 Tax=Zizania palustris TaxID=103762 RepID=A0A8J5TI97_ZIZPA|nr:hypothetical protein GUJ93_ZPchr0016g2548 [Zizania palustris]
MEQQIAELIKAMQTIQEQNASIQGSVAAASAVIEDMAPVVRELAGWRPRMDGAVEELRGEMGDLKAEVDRISRNPVLTVRPVDLPGLLPTPVKRSASEGVLPTLLKVEEALHRPDGHRLPTTNRGEIGRGFTPIDQTPDKGTLFDLSPTCAAPFHGDKGIRLGKEGGQGVKKRGVRCAFKVNCKATQC